MKHPWSSPSFRSGAKDAGRSKSTIDASIAAALAVKTVHPDLPVILTLGHLAHLAGVSLHDLQRVVFREEDPYRIFRVKKRGTPNGGAAPARRYRTICVPKPAIMRAQRWIAQNILNVIEPHPASYAFAPKRDLVGAAARHVEAKWLVKMDVCRFFESIPESRVYSVFRSLGYSALLSFQIARLCTRLPLPNHGVPGRASGRLPYRRRSEGHLPQGAPTSPMLANLVVRALDARIQTIASGSGWTYTRYADDLAFSRRDSASRSAAMYVVKQVDHSLADFGLKTNHLKTSIVPPGARKILLGVLVDSEKPRLTRQFRNNIETHLYALSDTKIGAASHKQTRGFASTIGMRRHIEGLIAFAHQVDREYASTLYNKLSTVDWTR